MRLVDSCKTSTHASNTRFPAENNSGPNAKAFQSLQARSLGRQKPRRHCSGRARISFQTPEVVREARRKPQASAHSAEPYVGGAKNKPDQANALDFDMCPSHS